MLESVRRYLFAGVWVVATALMFVPGENVPSALMFWDKAQHALAFSALTLLGYWAGWQTANLTRIGLGMAAYGAAVECVQALVPWRSGDPLDWFADLLGVAAGLALLHYFPQLAKRLKPTNHPTST